MQRKVTVPQQTVQLSSLKPYHELILNNGLLEGVPEISYGILTGVRITSLPEQLKSVDVLAGAAKIKTYQREDLIDTANLLPVEDESMAMADFYHTKLRFNYNEAFIEENEVVRVSEKYVHEVSFSDTEEEFFDGEDFVKGLRVYRKMVPTGQQEKQVVQAVEVVVPELRVTFVNR